MTFLVVCPFVSREQFDLMWAGMHPQLRDRALILDNTAANRGAAGSRNIGARLLAERDLDWMVDVSPATRFGPSGGLDFRDALAARPDAWVVQSSAPVNWHLIAWHRRVYERVGLWDENFWPIYGEDGDFSRRIHIAVEEDQRGAAWECVDVDAWVTMYGHSLRLAGVKVDMARTWEYYRRKWGGLSGHETFVRPFGRKPLDWWPTPPHAWAVNHEGWKL